MNERIGALYVVVVDNEVIAFETNMKVFVSVLNILIPGTRNYDWFFRAFKKEKRFSQTINNKEYFFQKLSSLPSQSDK